MATSPVIAAVVSLETDQVELTQTVALLARALGCSVRLVHIGGERDETGARSLADWFAGQGVSARVDWIEGRPPACFLELAPPVTLLALGTAGPDAPDALGAVTLGAIRHAPLPTLVVPAGGRLPARSRWRVLFPTDFTELASGALAPLARLCDELEAEVELLHVVRATADAAHVETALGRLQGVVVPTARAVRHHVVLGSHVGPAIVAEADRLRCDLIVLPTHHRSGLAGILRPSVAEAVARCADRPVLVLRSA